MRWLKILNFSGFEYKKLTNKVGSVLNMMIPYFAAPDFLVSSTFLLRF